MYNLYVQIHVRIDAFIVSSRIRVRFKEKIFLSIMHPLTRNEVNIKEERPTSMCKGIIIEVISFERTSTKECVQRVLFS